MEEEKEEEEEEEEEEVEDEEEEEQEEEATEEATEATEEEEEAESYTASHHVMASDTCPALRLSALALSSSRWLLRCSLPHFRAVADIARHVIGVPM